MLHPPAININIGRVVEETVYKIKVISEILKKPKIENKGISENIGVTLAEFSMIMLLEKGIFINFKEKAYLSFTHKKKFRVSAFLP